MMTEFEQRVAETIRRATRKHADSVSMITHPDYEPYVKLVCLICGIETYVKRHAEESEGADTEAPSD